MHNRLFSNSIRALDILTEAQKESIIKAYSNLLEDGEAPAPSSSPEPSSASSASPTKSSSTAPASSGKNDGLNIQVNTTRGYGLNKRTTPPKYLVLHYTAGGGSKTGRAAGTARQFSIGNPDSKGNLRLSSADFIVDDTTIWQYNPDPNKYYTNAVGVKAKDFKWYMSHPGATKPGPGYMHNVITNANSMSIEMCSTIDNSKEINNVNYTGWSFTPAVLENTKKLVAYILNTYKIDKNNIFIHYDVSGKRCPAMWTRDDDSYQKFLAFKSACQTGAPLKAYLNQVNMSSDKTYKNMDWYGKDVDGVKWIDEKKADELRSNLMHNSGQWFKNGIDDYDDGTNNVNEEAMGAIVSSLSPEVIAGITGDPSSVIVKLLASKFGQNALPVIKEFVGSFIKSGGLKNVIK